jgi:5-methylthioadenosine/S-adenosylhomocysteine deaminase
LLQKLAHGPEALPAARVLRMATIDGARSLGLEKEIGSIEAGKSADVIVVSLDQLHSSPSRDIVSALVYSALASDVRATVIEGRVLMRDGELLTMNEASVIEEANREASALAKRAGL